VAACSYSAVRKITDLMVLCEIYIQGHIEGITKLRIMDL